MHCDGMMGGRKGFGFRKLLSAVKQFSIAGAGGGFDVYAGLPIYHRLRSIGKQAYHLRRGPLQIRLNPLGSFRGAVHPRITDT
jgi:hypothetical protein